MCLVSREVVLNLVKQFAATGIETCSNYRPDELEAAFTDLPIVHRDGVAFVDCAEAARVLDHFECRLTSACNACNAWTLWMHTQIITRSFRLLDAVKKG